MKVQDFVKILGADFYTGVPDSLLKAFCYYLFNTYGVDPKHHVMAANEGNCAALAAGYHLATGKVPVVYMQNSGEGNIVNPAASLLNDKVYGIPVIFVVGWRGEPGVHDEPQHIYQGQITCSLLDELDIANTVVSADTTPAELELKMQEYRKLLDNGKDVAFVIRKGALSYDGTCEFRNDYTMKREEIIQHIVKYTGDDPVISTTGKASRELFETREAAGQGHQYDFLTVGSMGHCSSIALGVAEFHPDRKVWCIDGDGAVLMHMGAMPVIADCHPKNLVHIVINNGSYETVGGEPTVLADINIADIAKDCGYDRTVRVDTPAELDNALQRARDSEVLTLIEVMSSIGARADLGRPTTTAMENKESFMNFIMSS